MSRTVRVGVIMGSDSDWSVMQDAAAARIEPRVERRRGRRPR